MDSLSLSLSFLPPLPFSVSLSLYKHTIEIVRKLLIPSLETSLHVNKAITKLGIKLILPHKYEFTHKNQFFLTIETRWLFLLVLCFCAS